ncbi:MAG: PadR family transcriptional regulator [Natrialbaceae archaeon]|nr:PadR family transcriptional regulator [Natrialbaceae archaeon]
MGPSNSGTGEAGTGVPTTDDGLPWTELTGFQRDILVAIAIIDRTATPYGLAIKHQLEETYPDVNHGRLYPNLDDLRAYGLIEKGTIDDRTNSYELSEAGRKFLEDRADHLATVCDR